MNTLNPEPERQFLIKDKSGRGMQTTVTQTNLLNSHSDEPDWDGVELQDFATDADVGDTWETHNLKITRTI